MMLLLNFDGVLHPNAVRFTRTNMPVLDAPGHYLFESNTALANVATEFANLRIVLNTWWTYKVDIDMCLRRLPKVLSLRVVGSVLPHASSCPTLPHRISLASDTADASMIPILILDHADARYPKHLRPITFLLNPQVGLVDPQAVLALRRFISRAAKKTQSETRKSSGANREIG
jgi:hypothetical protein